MEDTKNENKQKCEKNCQIHLRHMHWSPIVKISKSVGRVTEM